VVGPCFMFKTYMYAVDRNGIRGALRRLTCVREPQDPLVHWQLMANQFANIRPAGFIKHWLIAMRARLTEKLSSVPFDADSWRDVWVDASHTKKPLRQRTRVERHQLGIHRPLLRKVPYKCKPGELLAYAKYLRAVGDLTPPGAERLGYFMDTVKSVFADDYVYQNVRAVFVKEPYREDLAEIFSRLLNPKHKIEFVYFSDDSCIAIQCVDGLFYCNLDIKACDGSNFDPIFWILWLLMSVDSRFKDDIDAAFAQLRTDCEVRSPENWKHFVIMFLRYYSLYSGSVLTTTVNNVANSMIVLFFNYFFTLNPNMTKAECPAALRLAASMAGFLIKVQMCSYPEDLQFLKHSPSVINGVVTPWLNIGVLLRGRGHRRGDYIGVTLPGESFVDSLLRRSRLYESEVIRSFVHAGDHPITDALRTWVVSERKAFNDIETKSMSRGGIVYPRIPLECIALRYRCSTCAVEELVDIIRSIKHRAGYLISLPVLDLIGDVDYGYT
jgi:hypothetical protein